MRHRIHNSQRWAVLRRSYYGTAFTCAFIELSHMIENLIDSILTSRMLDPTALTAICLSIPMFTVMSLFSGVLSSGAQSLCAKEIGCGNYKKYGEISTITLVVGAFLSLLCTFVLLIFAGPIASALGARGSAADLYEPIRQYTLGLYIGTPAIILNEILASSIHLDGGEGIVKRTVLIDCVLNATLDYVAIRLGMGLFGVGLATSVSRYISTACMALHFRRKDRMLHLGMQVSALREIPAVLSKGSMIAVRRCSSTIRQLVINNYIILLGGTAAATALSATLSAGRIALAFNYGIQNAIPLVVGIAYGEKSEEDIRGIGKLAHNATLVLNLAVFVTHSALAIPIANFFVPADTAIRNMTVFGICMIGMERYFGTLLLARIRYLNTISRSRDSRLLQFIISLPAAILGVLMMGSAFGAYGVLAGETAGYILTCVAIYILYAIRAKSPRVGVKRFLRLDDSFDIGPGDVIELDIRNMADAVLVSEQTQMFAGGHGIDAQRSLNAALAIEESARLIYEQNGFSKKARMDIRAVMSGDNLVIRIRDNGKSAYPFGGVGSEDASEDPLANIGIRLLRKTAKDITHYRSLGVNYTLITV